ncbi:MAG: helix-turn-helix domain-containing protein [Eubacterium sp.]|nr:helix-turn-helix domain-containing protein [Eubacterium sp.]
MILSEKITELRKKAGLSQEEFGAEIGVSRQAVSKWEMSQTTPDLNKIVKMSEFFEVPIDFLLKDEYDLSFLENHNIDSKDIDGDENKEAGNVEIDNPKTTVFAKGSSETKMIELPEIQSYLDIKKRAARKYVISIFLFFISPFAGIVISTFNEPYAVVGVIIQLLILIVTAIIFVLTLWKLAKFKTLFTGERELAYGVRSIVEEKKHHFEHTFIIGIIAGVICLIAFVIPVMAVSVFTDDNNVAIIISACMMLLIFATGVSIITYVVTVNQGFNKILKIR